MSQARGVCPGSSCPPGSEDSNCFNTDDNEGKEERSKSLRSYLTEIDVDDEGCRTYQIQIFDNGRFSQGLSHISVGIPCGEVVEVTNSRSWPVETDLIDPKTGIYGFRISNLVNPNKVPSSFTIEYTVCISSDDCSNLWTEQLVGYKAGQSVTYDTLAIGDHAIGERLAREQALEAERQSNPLLEDPFVEFSLGGDTHVTLEVYTVEGEKIAVIYEGEVLAGVTYKAEFVGRKYKQDHYLYKLITPHYTAAGELSFADTVPVPANPFEKLE